MNHYPNYAAGRLDPQAEALLTEWARSPSPPLSSLSPEEARATLTLPSWLGEPKRVADIRDFDIPGPGGRLPARVYVPDGGSPFPVVVFFHGGGFVTGTLAESNTFCTWLAAGADCAVVSVDYRLAPEHKGPAAVDDAVAALRWIGARAAELDCDPGRLAVAGDSAGGNLAATAARAARRERLPLPVLQVLICPWVDLSSCETESFRLFGQGRWLSTASVQWYRAHYLAHPEQATMPRVSPLLARDLSGLPPALMISAEFDVLRDQIEAYARRLEQSGNAVEYRLYPGTLHDFVTLPGLFDRAYEAVDDICSALRRAFVRAER